MEGQLLSLFQNFAKLFEKAYIDRENQFTKYENLLQGYAAMVSRSESRVDNLAQMVQSLVETAKLVSDGHIQSKLMLDEEKARCQRINEELIKQNGIMLEQKGELTNNITELANHISELTGKINDLQKQLTHERKSQKVLEAKLGEALKIISNLSNKDTVHNNVTLTPPNH